VPSATPLAHCIYMTRIVVFDIETTNQFSEVGSSDPAALDLALVCIHDSETNSYSTYFKEDLPQLWKILEYTDILVGFNSDHFDIPLLNKYYPGDLTSIQSLDLLNEVYKSLGRRIKLDAIAEGTLGTKKSGHGLQSIVWWREGKIDMVREYCLKDVEITKRIFEFALAKGGVHYAELGKKKDLKLDTRAWLTKKESALTHTLPW
jgi:DEAD/DEAH box helicase domain-containing protein